MSVSLVHCFPPLQSISLERYFHLELSGVLPAALIFFASSMSSGSILVPGIASFSVSELFSMNEVT